MLNLTVLEKIGAPVVALITVRDVDPIKTRIAVSTTKRPDMVALALLKVMTALKPMACSTIVGIMTDRVVVPFEPVTVTLYFPAGVEVAAETVSVARLLPFEGTVTVFGLITTEGPGGETPVERFTTPVKPLRLATVTVEGVEFPWARGSEVGFALKA